VNQKRQAFLATLQELDRFEQSIDECSNIDSGSIPNWFKFRSLLTDVEQTVISYGSDVLYNSKPITQEVDQAIQYFEDGDEKRYGY